MKNIALLILSLSVSSLLFSQEINNIVIDEMIDEEILLGYCDREGLSSDPFNIWFESEYDSYELNQEILDQIDTDLLSKIEIKIVLGTWCSDSQREVPRFYKIADYLSLTNLSVIAVNRNKNADGTELNELNIDLVPTFIFYHDSKEIGRIIESPADSLEKDLLNILLTI